MYWHGDGWKPWCMGRETEIERGTSRERGGEEGKVRGRAQDRRRRAGEWRSERGREEGLGRK